MLFSRWVLFLAFYLLALPVQAIEFIKAPHIQIDWLAPKIFSENGETLIGIRMRPDPEWHVYWKNPGDSGTAPTFQISAINATVSETVGEIMWPYPARLPVAHLTNFGYEGEVAYLFKVKTGSNSSIKIVAELEWLVCKIECVPGLAQLTLSRPTNGKASVFEKSVISKIQFFEQRIPTAGLDSPYRIELSETSGGILAVVTSQTTLPKKINLFPANTDYLTPAEPKIPKSDKKYVFIFDKSSVAPKPIDVDFVLTADGKAYEFSKVAWVPAPAPTETASFGVILFLLASALLGGLLLNLMPCVFPVISIKAVSLLNTENQNDRRRDGLLYTLGVLTTFTGLGAGFLILRGLGSAVGWGFQLQSPAVVLGLVILFWLMALNFLGVFEFGTAVMNKTGNINWHSSFGTGVLSVFIAAPCTGPFMGSALGATATMPSYQALLVFLSLGFGLALPYLALTLSPQLARRMPKPGAWMETLKQFFAFPLFATVLWLLWVLGQQTGTAGWMVSGSALLGISFALWLAKRQQKIFKYLAWCTATLIIIFSVQQIQTAADPKAEQSANDKWPSYSEEKLNTALAAGQPVFVDFTAAWCITCQVNKKAVLQTHAADQIFEKAGILRLKADWTKQDPLITNALARLGRNSVPVYAFYSGKNREPQLLPQLLTIEMIENLIPLKEEK